MPGAHQSAIAPARPDRYRLQSAQQQQLTYALLKSLMPRSLSLRSAGWRKVDQAENKTFWIVLSHDPA